MDAFRTEINITRQPFIDHRSKLITVGSCFADHLGDILASNKFKVLVNPFGVAYNPISIHRVINNVLANQGLSPDLFVERDGIWSHFDYHSRWSSPSREKLETKLKAASSETGIWLRTTNVLLITYGTAWVYEHKPSYKIVSNCHKVSSSSFDRRLLTPQEITTDFATMYEQIKKINPQAKVVLTVSPVRHVRDTLEGNQVSKSTVRLACHEIISRFPDVIYFPAYEMLLDDLRDYRFYASDLIHPSAVAQEYIWEKFKAAYVTDGAQTLINRWSPIRKAIDHRTFQPESASHQKFVNETLLKLKDISVDLDVSHEIDAFTRTNQVSNEERTTKN
jgi:hypothetical protein